VCSSFFCFGDWIKWSFREKRFVVFFTSEKKKKKSTKIMGKKLSGAAKRKKKKDREEAIVEAAADLERLKLGPTKLWTGLVTHHRDIFVSHVLPKLNATDQCFFVDANTESLHLLAYAGVNKSEMPWYIHECTSISTLEWAWNNTSWGWKFDDGTVADQPWFCRQVAQTNKLELLKWAREEKKCEWDEKTIIKAAYVGNLEMLKYCFANGCPYDEQESSRNAAGRGYLDCLRFLFDKVKPSRKTEKKAAETAAQYGRLNILKYFVEERKISDDAKINCVIHSVSKGRLNCVKYMVEEEKVPLDNWLPIAFARYFKHPECLHYLREKGCPEPTDEEYAFHVMSSKQAESLFQ
jgi:hypothetical protein